MALLRDASAETLLPFAVEQSVLGGGNGASWAAVARRGDSQALDVSLCSASGGRRPAARLDGFRSRPLQRAGAAISQHLYETFWLELEADRDGSAGAATSTCTLS